MKPTQSADKMRMSVLLLLSLAAAAAVPIAPAPPLAVAQVVREGWPPYEDANRLYRLEGEGCAQLQAGGILLLRRSREARALGRLEVVRVTPTFALARLAVPGETFPQRGDRVYQQEHLRALPALPSLAEPLAQPAPAAMEAPAPLPAAPGSEPGFATQREPLYFRQGETRLSPAGQTKLKAWVQAWGKTRRWSLACPPWPGEALDLSAARLTVLKDELKRLGVTRVDEVILSEEPPGRLPLIYVAADPW